MRKWWNRTFPSFAHWDAPTFMLMPIVVMIIFSVTMGLVEPLMGKGNFADCKTVSECYALHSDEIIAE